MDCTIDSSETCGCVGLEGGVQLVDEISGDWMTWSETDGVEMLRPEHAWEGAGAPLEPSVRSTAYGQVNQLRDPAILEDGERVFLLYAVAGESGIAIAEVHLDE